MNTTGAIDLSVYMRLVESVNDPTTDTKTRFFVIVCLLIYWIIQGFVVLAFVLQELIINGFAYVN